MKAHSFWYAASSILLAVVRCNAQAPAANLANGRLAAHIMEQVATSLNDIMPDKGKDEFNKYINKLGGGSDTASNGNPTPNPVQSNPAATVSGQTSQPTASTNLFDGPLTVKVLEAIEDRIIYKIKTKFESDTLPVNVTVPNLDTLEIELINATAKTGSYYAQGNMVNMTDISGYYGVMLGDVYYGTINFTSNNLPTKYNLHFQVSPILEQGCGTGKMLDTVNLSEIKVDFQDAVEIIQANPAILAAEPDTATLVFGAVTLQEDYYTFYAGGLPLAQVSAINGSILWYATEQLWAPLPDLNLATVKAVQKSLLSSPTLTLPQSVQDMYEAENPSGPPLANLTYSLLRADGLSSSPTTPIINSTSIEYMWGLFGLQGGYHNDRVYGYIVFEDEISRSPPEYKNYTSSQAPPNHIRFAYLTKEQAEELEIADEVAKLNITEVVIDFPEAMGKIENGVVFTQISLQQGNGNSGPLYYCSKGENNDLVASVSAITGEVVYGDMGQRKMKSIRHIPM